MGCVGYYESSKKMLAQAKAAGWSFSRPYQVFSSGCSKINAEIREAQNFINARDKALAATAAAKIENARLAEIARIAEIARLELIAKNDNIALALWTKLDNQRIAKQQAEIIRLQKVAQAQKQAEIKAENFRIKSLEEKEELEKVTKLEKIQEAANKEKQRIEKSIPLIASVLPVSIIGLLLYTSRGKN